MIPGQYRNEDEDRLREAEQSDGIYLAWIENSAVDKDPQHVYRAATLNPVIPERTQRILDPLRVGGIQLQGTIGRNIGSRAQLFIRVLLHAEPTHP